MGAAYGYLKYNFDKQIKDADQKDYTVPYVQTPESCGIVFVYPDNSATLVYLDFNEESIRLLDIEAFDSTRPEYYGYTADYTVHTSYELIEGIVDRVGGIEIEYQGEKMRYTGVQVIEMISYGKVDNIKRQILLQIFDKISKNSFSKDDFVYIIENSESDLSFIDCINWLDHLKGMSGRINYIN